MEVLTTVERGDIKRHEDDGERRGQRTRGMETANGGDDERQGWRTVGTTVGMGTTTKKKYQGRRRGITAGRGHDKEQQGQRTTTLNAG